MSVSQSSKNCETSVGIQLLMSHFRDFDDVSPLPTAPKPKTFPLRNSSRHKQNQQTHHPKQTQANDNVPSMSINPHYRPPRCHRNGAPPLEFVQPTKTTRHREVAKSRPSPSSDSLARFPVSGACAGSKVVACEVDG